MKHIENYPRPQLVRDSWIELNGEWDFAFDNEKTGEKSHWEMGIPLVEKRKILVPFSPETKESGVHIQNHSGYLWYQRMLPVNKKELEGKRFILHFEGVDYLSKVYINGKQVGQHCGGYSRFSFDVTEYIEDKENILTVLAIDSSYMEQPRGKQRWEQYSYACWYVQTSGIWKSVWGEVVNQRYIKDVKITPHLYEHTVEIEGLVEDACLLSVETKQSKCPLFANVKVKYQNIDVTEVQAIVQEGRFKLKVYLDNPAIDPFLVKRWSPQEPNLYDLEIKIKEEDGVLDSVFSYFGLREIRIEEGKFLLNGCPLYQRLILDQGYWKDTGLTPKDEEALLHDLQKIKEMGFNGVRKHQKIEDERFLYLCDTMGILVWSEFPSNYRFNQESIMAFTKEWMEAVKQNYNHPSIIAWTPFNESWGVFEIEKEKAEQYLTEGIYYLTKSLDPYRPVISNDGWEHTKTDLLTLHDYTERGEDFYKRYSAFIEQMKTTEEYHCGFKSAFSNGYQYDKQPILLTEYGGIAFSTKEKEQWGYGNTVETEEAFLERYESITKAIIELPFFQGFCYTQLTDVEQEVNGLLDENHEYKVSPEAIRKINLTRPSDGRLIHLFD